MLRSYAQCGQDCFASFLLARHNLIERDKDYKGFYVDVGCAQPTTGSNTYMFYEMGWRGICIDANPDNQEAFLSKRPEDIYVNAGVSDEAGVLPFHVFGNPQRNTFLTGRVESKSADYLKTIDIPVRTLEAILEEVLPEDRRIDFMSIDIEHYELQALNGLNLGRFRPSLIVVEAIAPIAKAISRPVTRLMNRHGYELTAHTGHDSFFIAR